MCHLYSAGLPPQCLVELQFQDQLCIDTRNVHQPIMPSFRSQVCRLAKLQFRDRLCIDTRIVQQPIMPGFDGGVHPGGSVRDEETLAVADAAGMAVVHTGVRHFRH